MSDSGKDRGPESVLARLGSAGRSAPRLRLDGDGVSEPVPLRTSSRYEISGEIARGGVGVVLRGRDVDLGRDVAMKVLREEHSSSPDLVRRFVEEAQVGGQLQHPGIVPVYELGLQPDGRPFFAMKLVKGRTLSAALAARKSTDDDRRRFLAVFESACQTMAYAHSRGVVHRDLKPSNVMIGAFGEVQVVDWGFAKVLAAGGVADEKRAKREGRGTTIVATVRSGSSGSGSVAGSVMGTPAYMPPEQALGHVEHVDERSDVFALGAILCEILTGKPPYVGDGLIEQAARCKLDDAKSRLDACGADDAMVQLARACLAPLPRERPKDASEVAKAVSTYLAEAGERAHRSKLGAIEAKSKAEKARAAADEARADAADRVRGRRQTRLIAAAVLVAVVVGGIVWSSIESRRASRARATAAAVDEALQDATRLGAAEEWTKALAAAERARSLAGGDDVALAARIAALHSEIVAKETAAREKDAAAARDAAFLATLDDLRARKGSEAWSKAEPLEAAAWRAYGIDVDTMDVPSTAARIRARGTEFAARVAVTLDNWVQLRTDGKFTTTRDIPRLLALTRALDDDPWRNRLRDAIANSDLKALRAMAASPEALEQPARTIALLSVSLVGDSRAVEWERTVEDRIAAVDLLRRAHPRHAGDFWINYDLGSFLTDLGTAEAREAVRHCMAALALRPDAARAVEALACAHIECGEPRRALELLERELPKHAERGFLHNRLSIARRAVGDFVGAEAAGREAMRLDPEFAPLRFNVVLFILDRGDVDRALREAQAFVSANPGESAAHHALATVLRRRGDAKGEVGAYRAAIRIRPNDDRTLTSLANALNGAGDTRGAIEAATGAIRVNARNAEAWFQLGTAQLQSNDNAAALVSSRKAIEIGGLTNDSYAWNHVGIAQELLGNDRESETAYRRAIEVDPKNAEARLNLAMLLRRHRWLEEALAEARRAAELLPRKADCHELAGRILVDLGDHAEALGEFRRCVEVDPASGAGRIWLGSMLQATGDDDGAVEEVRKGLALTLSNSDACIAHQALGRALWRKWNMEEALAEFQAAVDSNDKDPIAQRNLGIALTLMRRDEEAVGPLREACRLDPRNPRLAFDLAGALVGEGEFAEALTLFRGLSTAAAGALADPARAWAKEVERLIHLDDSLAAALAGKGKPKDAAEAASLVSLGCLRARYAGTARLAKACIAADAKLAEDPAAGVRYNAACAAVLAAAGEGDDADDLTDAERAAWRGQALEWLAAELRRDAAELGSASKEAAQLARERILGLRFDPDLDSVRGAEAIETLPAAERAAWRAFWKDVDAAFEKAKAAGPLRTQ